MTVWHPFCCLAWNHTDDSSKPISEPRHAGEEPCWTSYFAEEPYTRNRPLASKEMRSLRKPAQEWRWGDALALSSWKSQAADVGIAGAVVAK